MYYIFAGLGGLSFILSMFKPWHPQLVSPTFDIIPTLMSWFVWINLYPFIGVEWALIGFLFDIIGVIPVLIFWIENGAKMYMSEAAKVAYGFILTVNFFQILTSGYAIYAWMMYWGNTATYWIGNSISYVISGQTVTLDYASTQTLAGAVTTIPT